MAEIEDSHAFVKAIEVVKADIVGMDVDAVVNAANERLRAGGGVCGAIFDAAGRDDLQRACEAIGHCDTGSAVITPGFALKARYVIHAVGPRWTDGNHGEEAFLASCYARALDLALENGCTSIAFPLISSGIFGYPKREAWQVALTTCADWLREHAGAGASADPTIKITFCVLSDSSLALAESVISE